MVIGKRWRNPRQLPGLRCDHLVEQRAHPRVPGVDRAVRLVSLPIDSRRAANASEVGAPPVLRSALDGLPELVVLHEVDEIRRRFPVLEHVAGVKRARADPGRRMTARPRSQDVLSVNAR